VVITTQNGDEPLGGIDVANPAPAGDVLDRLSNTLSGGLGRYFVAAVLIRLVDEGARVALVLLALDQTSSAGVGGLLVAALLVPHVVAAPGIGWLTDRAQRPRLVLSAAALGFAAALAAAALLLGRAPLGVVVAVLLAGGCCGPAITGGLTSQLSGLVPEDQLPRAFGVDSLTYNISGIVGPAVAGTLAGIWGPGPATSTLAAVAAGGAAVLASLPLDARSVETRASASPPLTSGVQAIIHDRVLRTVTTASSLGQLGPGALAVVAAVLAAALGRPAAAGWLLTSVALGGLLGSLWWTWRPASATRAARTVMLTLVGVGAPLALAAATTSSLIVTAALFAVSGVFLGPLTGALFTTRQAHAPEAARAQVFAISAGLKTMAAAAGAAIGGSIAHIPSSTQLLVVGTSPILAGALGGLALAAGRKKEKPAELTGHSAA
jgi:MFS family permease